MSRSLAVILLTLALGAGRLASAHDGTTHAADPAAPSGLPTVHETANVDPEGGSAPTVEAPQGRKLVLTILGAGEGVLHLHGYDIEIASVAGEPAVLTFDALHAGRFPVSMHVNDLLLGDIEKPVLFIEVRAP